MKFQLSQNEAKHDTNTKRRLIRVKNKKIEKKENCTPGIAKNKINKKTFIHVQNLQTGSIEDMLSHKTTSTSMRRRKKKKMSKIPYLYNGSKIRLTKGKIYTRIEVQFIMKVVNNKEKNTEEKNEINKNSLHTAGKKVRVYSLPYYLYTIIRKT